MNLRLMGKEGIELIRDNELISLIEDYKLTANQVDKVASRLKLHL